MDQEGFCIVKAEDVEVYDNEIPQPKETSGCIPIMFTLSDTNLKFGLITDSNIIKMGTMLHNSGVFVCNGVYNVACFFSNFMVSF